MSEIDLGNMVLNDIDVELVTNSAGTGVFDKLMSAVNSNINEQYSSNRINGSDYANVYLGSLQAVLSQSIQFVLQEQISEAQISAILKDNALKSKQLEVAEIEKAMKQYELDNVLPKQLLKLQEEIDLLVTQDSEMLLDGAKKRLTMDEEIETADLQQTLLGTENALKTAQKDEITKATLRAQSKLDSELLTDAEQREGMYTERVVKDKQAAKLGLDNVMKNSEALRIDENYVYLPKYTKI